MPNPVVIISPEDFAEADRLARITFARFNKSKGHYNNTDNSHLRGKVGEFACASWLRSEGVEADEVFRDLDRMRECDIIASAKQVLRLDVKTWDAGGWDEMGRCAAVDQIEKLCKKTDAIVWCISPKALSAGVKIEVVGWSTMVDVKAAPQRWTGQHLPRSIFNHQVDQDQLQPIVDLLAALRTA